MPDTTDLLLTRRSLLGLIPAVYAAGVPSQVAAQGGTALSNSVEAKIKAMGLVLPSGPPIAPSGARFPFVFVRVRGNRAYVAGHGPANPDGTIGGPFGKVGGTVTVEQAYQAARSTGLNILASLQREIGDLNRIAAWLRVFGRVNSAPGFNRQPWVINGFSDLILELYGPERGAHARSAVGMAELPFDIPVEIEAEVELVS
ncbi:MAG: RidA family protein [candidate division Zixibacteria bacterium]|nr:RidA family protein [candidate division Zixibacteria bacterium]